MRLALGQLVGWLVVLSISTGEGVVGAVARALVWLFRCSVAVMPRG